MNVVCSKQLLIFQININNFAETFNITSNGLCCCDWMQSETEKEWEKNPFRNGVMCVDVATNPIRLYCLSRTKTETKIRLKRKTVSMKWESQQNKCNTIQAQFIRFVSIVRWCGFIENYRPFDCCSLHVPVFILSPAQLLVYYLYFICILFYLYFMNVIAIKAYGYYSCCCHTTFSFEIVQLTKFPLEHIFHLKWDYDVVAASHTISTFVHIFSIFGWNII